MNNAVRLRTVLCILICIANYALGANPQEKPDLQKEQISTTKHKMQLNGKELQYTAIAGFLPIMNESNEVQANMFFTAYIKDGQDSVKRPVAFAFNGGPGASSVWLHLGCLGPKRVVLEGDGNSSPYALIDNEYTWLDSTDIVLIDPVGTGFSFATDEKNEKDFFEIHKDVSSVGSFIRLFLTKYQRWQSPKYLIGESYGTLRAVGLLNHLPREYGVQIDGVALISSALNFETIMFKRGNDLPYSLYLPSYTAAAWYHKKLNKDLQADLYKAIKESRDWAENKYLVMLAKGDNLSADEQSELSENLAKYTGLAPAFIKNNNFRIEVFTFISKLLEDNRLQTGLMDSRMTIVTVPPDYDYVDPSLLSAQIKLSTAFNEYLAKDLDIHILKPYKTLSSKVNSGWQWGSASGGFVDFTGDLSKAIVANEKLKIFAAMGYYDLTTPFRTQEYSFDHLGLPAALRKNIHCFYYPSGHQIYTSQESIKKLKDDIGHFFSE